MAQEFLPLCDVLFNIISLASYFCDIVFDVLSVYTLYADSDYIWFIISLACVLTSLFVSQILSLKWYLKRSEERPATLSLVFLLHLFQWGVLWRYFKLFVPVELTQVKIEVRDLCMLRMVHAFTEAAPMLLVQLYLIWLKPNINEVTDLNVVSTLLSLFSMCWALASFNKNVRRRNMHRLVLTWLGVIFQFLWRVGSVASRAVALTVYATLYHYWVFAVIGLHWFSMFLWLVSPKNIFHGENISGVKKVTYSMLVAYVYIFCYVNLQEVNPRPKMITFYITMFLENTLLMAVWLGLTDEVKWFHYPTAAMVWGGFFLGCLFMSIYYWFFHVKRLKHFLTNGQAANVSHDSTNQSVTSSYLVSDGNLINVKSKMAPNFKTQKSAIFHSGSTNHIHPYQNGVPGVFNCRLNPALKRKKKKPSTFVPPPAGPPTVNTTNSVPAPVINNGKQATPFWKRALPDKEQSSPTKYCNSDHESVGSRVNIAQKLQEKKQQQLAELKEIEEEIKQGKLKRPHPMSSDQTCTHQPIPHIKKQPWFQPDLPSLIESQMMYYSMLGCPAPLPLHYAQPRRKRRSQTPEILLAPHYLDNSRVYYDYQEPRSYSILPNLLQRQNSNVSSLFEQAPPIRLAPPPLDEDGIYKSYRIPSDLDSQISLPRSYTLPREFRFYRRQKARKATRGEHLGVGGPSNNSSDGDVDSIDDNDLDTIERIQPRIRQYAIRNGNTRQLHETKL